MGLGHVGVGETGQVDEVAVELLLELDGLGEAALVELLGDDGEQVAVLLEQLLHGVRVRARSAALSRLGEHFRHPLRSAFSQ